MPTLKIDDFPHAPNEGDKIKVLGKVTSINEDSGEVEVSYDDVSFVKKKKNDKSKDDSDNSDSNSTDHMDEQVMPESQSLDYALNQAFNKTQ